LSIFDKQVLTNTKRLVSRAKTSLMILLGFTVGCHGFMELISEYNAQIASAMSLLLWVYMGSAMVRSLARVQGVVFGMVMGQILHQIFGYCTWWGIFGVGFSLILLICVGHFLSFNSRTSYSTVGFLIAAFGCMHLLQACAGDGTFISVHRKFDSMACHIVALFLMVAMDLIFSRSRASDDAHQALLRSLYFIKDRVKHLFDKAEKNSLPHRGQIAQLVEEAKAMGNQASEEPRYWRAPFQTELFSKAVGTFHRMRFSLSMAEISTSEKGELGGPKSQALNDLLDMDSFGAVIKILQEKMDVLEQLLEVFNHESPTKMVLQQRLAHECQRDFISEWSSALGHFLNEFSRGKLLVDKKDLNTVEKDPLAQLSVVFASTTAIITDVSELRYAILKATADVRSDFAGATKLLPGPRKLLPGTSSISLQP